MRLLSAKRAKPLRSWLLGPRRCPESIEGASPSRSAFKFALSVLLISLLFPLLAAFTKAAPPTSELGTLTPSPLSDVAPEVLTKIEPLVLKQLTGASEAGPERANGSSRGEVARDRKTTYLVYLKEQADLAPAQRILEKLARRQSVVSSLQAVAERSQRGLRAYLDKQRASGHVEGYTPFWVFNGLAVTGDLETLLALAARPEVEMIRANHKHQLPNPKSKIQNSKFKIQNPNLQSPISTQYAIRSTQSVEWNIAKVRADQVWRELGITGRGVVVANMDSGVDWTHPALRGKYRGATGDHNYNWYDATGNYPYIPSDRKGHGTHTMGIIVGSDPGSNYYIGMAPDAQWIAVKVLDDEGIGYDTWIHAGFQWLLAPTDLNGKNPDPSKAPDVVNNSWGPYPPNVADPTFLPDVRALRAAGILPVFSAGNEGELGDGTVAAPASFPESLAIGATDFEDAIASFSSRGPSFWGEIKPEVCAPGVDIRSSIPGGRYEGGWSGTSMATPHVAGLAALLLEANPTLTTDDLENFMRFTAIDLGQVGPDNACGWGRIDAYDAVRWALGAGKLYGQVQDARCKMQDSCLLPPASCLLPPASCLLPPASCLLPPASCFLPGAIVSGVSQAGDRFVATTDATGVYTVSVPGSLYEVTASAFGYLSATVKAVEVITGLMSVQDFALRPSPTGILAGRVTEMGTGEPLMATISAVDTPASTTTDANGYYTLTVPASTYAVKAASHGHKAQTVTGISIVPDEPQTMDFALETAPSILLVDADLWTGDSVANYYQWALDYDGYSYETRPITDTDYLPTATELSPYDVVIWANPWSSPGYINADEALIDYLDNGGRLLISGQDIGYWDSDWPGWGRAPLFYQNYLYADLVRDKARINKLKGLDDDILQGVNLSLEDVYAYKKGKYLASDEVKPADGCATSIINYEGDGSGGLKTDVCAPNPYRTVYLSFGYEDAGPRPGYAVVLDKAIQWLIAPRPQMAISLRPKNQYQVGQAGTSIQYPVRVVNDGQTASAYDLSLSGNAWPTTILDSQTMNPITRTGVLSPCGWQDLVVQVDIPGSAAVGEVDMGTIQATMSDDPNVFNTAALTTRAFPAWEYKSWMLTSRYRLAAAAVGCELYAIGGWDWTGASQLNEMYDPVANYWMPKAPKPTGAANVGAAVLNGRIYVVGGLANNLIPLSPVEVYDPATDSWSSVAPLPVGLSGAAVAAARGKLYVFGGDNNSGAVDTTYEYDPATETWTPKAAMPGGPRSYAAATVLNGRIYVAGGWPDLRTFEEYDPATDTWTTKAPLLIGRQSPGLVAIGDYIYAIGGGSEWSALGTVERYAPATDTWVLVSSLNKGRIGMGTAVVAGGIYAVGGIDVYGEAMPTNEGLALENSLCPSIKKVDKVTALPGEVLTYTIALRNLGDSDFAMVTLVDPVPANTTYVPGSVSGGAIHNEDTDQIEWSGTVAAQTSITFTYQVTLDSPLLGGTIIANVMTVNDGRGTRFTKKTATKIQAANLETSQKQVDKRAASAGEVLTYTLILTNTGLVEALDASLVDPLPAHTTYVPDSATGGAVYNPLLNRIEWRGTVSPTVPEKTAYSWLDSDTPGGPNYHWEEISETGTEITSWTDRNNGFAGPLNIGFDFPFFGKVYSNTLYVGTNGYVSFGQAYSGIPIGTLPSRSYPNNDIMPFGGPMYIMSGVSHVYYQLLGDPLRFVIEFVDIQWCCGLNTSHTFEIVLYPSGEILTQYKSLHGDIPWVVGIENEDGSEGLNYPPSLIHDGLAIKYLPPAPPCPPHVISFQARVNDFVPPETVIVNTATISDGVGFSYTRTVTTTAHIVDLWASTKTVKPLAVPGDALTYTILLRNSGEATEAGFADPIPAHTRYVPGSVTGGATYNEALNRIQWGGTIPANSERAFTFAVATDSSLPNGTLIVNVATITDGVHPPFTRAATTVLKRPDLSTSEKLVSAARAVVGDVITYTLRVKNIGEGLARAILTDSIPAGSLYVPGSAWSGNGTVVYDERNDAIVWNGEVPPQSMSTVIFAVTVAEERVVHNTVIIDDGLGGLTERTAITKVSPYEVYLPLLLKSRAPRMESYQ
jgi:uncharacterized repeat protein (TIGR01451 family)